ncbi:MAG: sodium:solute symporter [Flavobacterium sp.]|uniref:sodium:solute symporter n=1 Tax=Flavobacterium sp. TaxID=239 RepID=UPI001B643E56|nr:sodium:solute symporter [Flavobacterium sp.]MBP6147265.1 sodium:solute symporter [Flavobacterium sp.]MBP7182550.1 sodium:solute symporter [Flavobacterium sp.]MBP7319036.1 sodium:solute symporter [Flavobacterium sp.]MBP8887585.1 sodium:solute symporter [Flavobacterium sp.]HRL72026.1 sodium:solute symporter [Flavobacterium sp.]
MQLFDWIILIVTLLFIVIYGAWKTKGSKNVEDFILGGNETPWHIVGLSVMATQASAITFLSTPGQAYHDGMGFVQFYFGLPIAMVVICITFIPLYHKYKVYTAYEYLEKRFDLKTRSLAAVLFLFQRGLGTGLTIYAPAIILSAILGWNLTYMNIVIGVLVIVYTFSGGTKAVNVTQKQQMFVIMSGMFITFFLILRYLPNDMTFTSALHIAGANDKMNIVNFSFDPEEKYTFWSGITGGFFLALAYFGTDQSQVGRYLSGRSVKESQMGLIMNGLLKVPMQFFILLTGVMVFVFFQFNPVPLNFNPNNKAMIEKSAYKGEYNALEKKLDDLSEDKKVINLLYIDQLNQDYDNPTLRKELVTLSNKEKDLRDRAKEIILKADSNSETNDKDYVFFHFILNYLPKGLIGLLLAVIISAAMSSTASGLNALASTTAIDIYKRNVKVEKSERHYLNATKFFTLLWGIIAILFACIGTLFENLIQLVNIIGSIFYGTVLGIFLVGFYLHKVQSKAIFYSAVVSQITIFIIYYYAIYIFPSGQEKLGYLWLNFIGAMLTIVISLLLQWTIFRKQKAIMV